MSRPSIYRCLMLITALLCCPIGYAVADDLPTLDDVYHAWRRRQAMTETLSADTQILTNYAAHSFIVPGKKERQPIAPRSSRRTATLRLSDAYRWRLDHRGEQFHRRFGQMLHFDVTRLCDGNQCVLIERPYKEIDDWTPKPRTYSFPRRFGHEQDWFDIALAPLLLHYRPYNVLHSPFVDVPYTVDPKWHTVDGQRCLVLRPGKDAPYSVRTYRYWVAPDKAYSVVRIERHLNDEVEWSFAINYVNRSNAAEDNLWQPSSYQIRRMWSDQMIEFSKVTVKKLTVNGAVDDSIFQYQP